METIVIDTCSVVNLINSNLASDVLGDPNFKFIVGSIVRLELSKEARQLPDINELEKEGLLTYYSEPLDLEVVSQLFEQFQLGDGETECIAIAMKLGVRMCCDDRKARTSAESKIGKENCLGSIAALKNAVDNNKLICSVANAGYEEMKNKGGYLPKGIHRSYFCKAS